MQSGLELTLNLLGTTRNEAAVGVLLDALASDDLATQQRAMEGILRRRSPRGMREILRRWHTFSPKLKAVTAEYRGRLAGAIRDAVLSRDDQLCTNGCDAALVGPEYEVIPALITVVQSKRDRQVATAAQTMVELTQQLRDELNRAKDPRERRDPQLALAHVSTTLESAVRQYANHKRTEILTAFLNLAGRDNATLKRILRDPADPAHKECVQLLSHSPRPAMVRLAISFLEDTRAPQAALQIIACRKDDLFMQHLLQTVGDDPSPGIRGSLKQLTELQLLPAALAQLPLLDERAQVALANLVGYSGLPLAEVMSTFRELLSGGKPRARRTVAKLLQEFEGVDANRLIMQALREGDIEVQALAMVQLRPRGLPGAMATLIEALDSPHQRLQEVARDCLCEFDLSRYLNAYEAMSDDVRENTGKLVSKVDRNAAALLREELQSASRSRRLRAIEVAQSLGLVTELENSFHALLEDNDHLIRMEAVEALASCPTEKTRLALRSATLDSSAVVRTAAQRALEEMVTAGQRRERALDAAQIQSPADLAREQGGLAW